MLLPARVVVSGARRTRGARAENVCVNMSDFCNVIYNVNERRVAGLVRSGGFVVPVRRRSLRQNDGCRRKTPGDSIAAWVVYTGCSEVPGRCWYALLSVFVHLY